jgi:hypothetical protein
MRVWQRRNTIIGVAVAVVLTAGLVVGLTGIPASSRPARAATTIVIDSNIGETFAPAPRYAAPKLTAEQAFALQRRRHGRRVIPIPAGVTVRLGLLTILAGPTNPHTGHVVTKDGIAYAALNELAWGYSWHWCPMSRNPLRPGRVHGPCTRWNFLNADTGREIDENWQQGRPPPRLAGHRS